MVGRVLNRLRQSARTLGVLIPLILLWIVLSIISPVFLTQINIANLLLQASILAILAYGSTIVLITREIDLSIGAVEGLTAVMSAIVVIRLGAPWWAGVAAAILIGSCIGLANAFIAIVIGIPSFITTLATLGIATGVAQTISEGETISGFPTEYQTIGQHNVILDIRLPVFIALGVLVALYVLLRHTPLGVYFYAVGGDPHAASLAGVRLRFVKMTAFVINGACVGLAGVLISARLDAANSTFGAPDLLLAIAAVVIGGTALTGGVGSVIGTTFGVLIIVTIVNGLTLLNASPLWTPAFIGGVILCAAMIHRTTSGRASG